MESGTIAWCKLIQLGVHLAFDYRFRPERFHTLKIESDFFSRQGHLTLYWTAVYQSLLLKKNQRRSSFLFFLENGFLLFFVVSLYWNIFYSFLHRKEMLIYLKICCDDIKHRREKQNKETKQLQKNNCCWYIETKLVLLFNAVYMYLLSRRRKENNIRFSYLHIYIIFQQFYFAGQSLAFVCPQILVPTISDFDWPKQALTTRLEISPFTI